MIQTLIGPILGIATEFLKRRAEEKQAVHERKLEVIKQDSNWENIQAGNAGNSWKDEWFTIFSTVCLIGTKHS